MKLYPFGLNYFSLFVPDIMHEFDLGVWKAVFVHLIRILHIVGTSAVDELNERYRVSPAFGSTIRAITSNAASMRQLTAHDFEDLLLVSMPVFEGLLLPKAEHDSILLDLLFTLNEWMCLAKLHLQTETTLSLLAESTASLGKLLRRFASIVCVEYMTKDLPEEESVAARKKVRAAQKEGEQSVNTLIPFAALEPDPAAVTQVTPQADRIEDSLVRASEGISAPQESSSNPLSSKGSSKPPRQFSLSTYKIHALGDYVDTIRRYGTTDSYSTRLVSQSSYGSRIYLFLIKMQGETNHKLVKAAYRRTNKKATDDQLATTEHRLRIVGFKKDVPQAQRLVNPSNTSFYMSLERRNYLNIFMLGVSQRNEEIYEVNS